MDTRGTMFFEIERILKDKKPFGFILENVEGLINHDKVDKNAKTGRTLATIIDHLEALGY
jgi:DNA (cytosine-5)-methyltransferase 1